MVEKDIEKELFNEEDQTSSEEITKEEKDTKKKKKKSKKDELEDQVIELKEALEEFKSKYYRILADTENYKKRTTNEMIKDRKYASQSLADKLIDSLEVFSQALNINTDNKQMQNFLYGFKMIRDMIFNALKDEGVSTIETQIGDSYDPEIHEAMDTDYDPEKEEHTILKITKTGYKFKDRVLRPAFVVTNVKPEDKEENNEDIDQTIENGEDE